MRTRKLVVAGVTATTLFGGGATAYAADPHGHAPAGGSGRGRPGAPVSPPGFQHAETVTGSLVKGFTTTDSQRGTVTAYTAGSSITVRSADSYSKTYVVTSATKTDFGRPPKGAIIVGDTVDVTAKLAEGTDTATQITDHAVPTATATASATS